jgi:glutamine synthetase
MADRERTEAGCADLVTFAVTDFAGITRGRSILRREYEAAGGVKSLGWVPANLSLTPFDIIAESNPWGSRGDLRIIPDPQARFTAWPHGSATPLDMVMSDIVELDGTPWTCCPRSFLKKAIEDFRAETGLEFIASFEQEFQVLGASWPDAPAFSLAAVRRADPFGPAVMAALMQAGTDPETFLSEYGADQFEITVAPAPGLVAADRSIAVREIVREVARLQGWHASFAPKTSEQGVGNGVHVHFSFQDGSGRPVSYDPNEPFALAKPARYFAAGIVCHLPALVAFTCPSPVSYLRLKPHQWSASYTWLGERDRESSVRICPVHVIGGADPARQFNLEFRAADATANPYLVLGLIVRAGLEGIRKKLDRPTVWSGDPESLAPEERRKLSLERLPGSLPEALEALEADEVVKSWFSKIALETITGMKATELKLAAELKGEALLARYARIY